MTPWFWIILAFALLCIFACSMEAFERRWARAFVAGLLAAEAFWFLNTGWV